MVRSLFLFEELVSLKIVYYLLDFFLLVALDVFFVLTRMLLLILEFLTIYIQFLFYFLREITLIALKVSEDTLFKRRVAVVVKNLSNYMPAFQFRAHLLNTVLTQIFNWHFRDTIWTKISKIAFNSEIIRDSLIFYDRIRIHCIFIEFILIFSDK